MIQESDKKTRRDFIFFVSGIPADMFVRHPQRVLTAVGEVEKKIISEISDQIDAQALANWLRGAAGQFCAAIFRNEHADERDGFDDAFKNLSGILDGYAFLIEDKNLEICPFVLIRPQDEQDAKIKAFGNRGWITWGSTTEDTQKAWRARRANLLQRFLLFFEAIAKDQPRFDTEVANQLNLSAKMFRHGCKSESYGIEFLCKFTALEGLVCGPIEQGHGKLLEQRLSSLFRTRHEIRTEVRALWRSRCEASHQGKAFSAIFSTMIAPVEELTLGTIVFALDNLRTVKTIDELWKKAPAYSLPPEIKMKRPQSRLQILHMSSEVGIWGGAGALTDAVFKQLRQEAAD